MPAVSPLSLLYSALLLHVSTPILALRPKVSFPGYFRSRAVDTFPPCPFSLTVKSLIPVRSLGLDSLGVD